MTKESKQVHLIANKKSGKGNGATLFEIFDKICKEQGFQLKDYQTTGAQTMDDICEQAVKAAQADGGIVVAAGGDGTIRSVAQHAAGSGVRFAAVPCGTFNFFARTHNIPEDLEAALQVAIHGQPTDIRLGDVNGHIFLINASLGLYAKAIKEREMRTSRWGRNRLVVIISTLMSMLSAHRLLSVDIVINGKVEIFRTSMIFIGNNALQLRDLSMDVAKCMKQNMLAVVMLKAANQFNMVKTLMMGVTKTLEQAENVNSFCVDSLTIHTRSHTQTVALDGEIFNLKTPLEIKALPGALRLMKPL